MERVDVAVVGGGIIGLSTALAVVRRGRQVVLLDAGLPGASAAANGAITTFSDQTMTAFATELAISTSASYRSHIESLSDETGLAIDYDTGGVLQLLMPNDSVEVAEAEFRRLRDGGAAVRWCDQSDVLDLEPRVTPKCTAGIHYEDETRIDVPQLLHATRQALAMHGCEPRASSLVTHVVAESDRVRLTGACGPEEQLLEASVVIMATGSGDCEIAGHPPLAIERVRGEILQVSGPPGLLNRCLYRGDSFITPRRDGRLLLGTNYESYLPGMNEDPDSISVAGAMDLLSAAQAILPGVRSMELQRVWKGWRPALKSGGPRIGPLGSKRIIGMLGFSGFGYTTAIRAAELASDEVNTVLEASA